MKKDYKMTELGELPDEWEIKELREVAEIKKGITYKSEDYCDKDEGVIFFNLKCVSKNGGFNPEGIKYYGGLYETEHIIYFGDVVIANTDLTRNGDIIGCPVEIPRHLMGKIVCISMDLSKIEAKKQILSKKFAYYFLQGEYSRKFMKNNSSGKTILHLNVKALPKFKVLLPPLPEQQRIAEILTTVDETIEHTEALIEKYRNIKKGLTADLLTRGIDKDGRIRSEETHRFKDSPLGKIPEEWEVKKVDDILILKGGSTPSTINDKYWNGKIPWVVPTDVTKLKSKFINNTERKITKDGLLNCSATLLPKGSILLTSRATIGFLAINEVEMATNQGFINILPSKEVSNIFLYYFLDYIKTKFILQASGSTFLELSKNSFRKFCIPHPHFPEQQRIAEILMIADNRIEKEQAYLNKFLQLKKGLMQDLLTGRVRVNKYIEGKYNV